MVNYFYKNPMRVEINGVDVTHVLSFTVDAIARESEIFSVLDTNHDIEAEFYNMANGSMEMKAMHREHGSDPASLMDVLSFALGHWEYDTATDSLALVDDDLTSMTSGEASTGRIVEIRQTEALGSQKIDNEGGDSEAWAQSFVAGGEDIYAIKLKCYTTVGGPLESFQMEIWSDSAGLPDAIVASTNTVTVECDTGVDTETTDYIGALDNGSAFGHAVWETIDMSLSLPDIMDGESLVIGDTYWLVIKETATSTDDLFIAYSTNDNYAGGECKRDDDVDVAPAWGDATAGAKDLCFIIQFMTDDGLQISVYDYYDGTSGIKYQFDKVKISNDSGYGFTPKQVTTGSINWSSSDVTISTF